MQRHEVLGGAGTMAFQYVNEGIERSEPNVRGVLFPFDGENQGKQRKQQGMT